MLFLLKKWIGGLLMPLPFALLLLLIGLLLLFFSKRQKLGKMFATSSFILLFCFSFLPVTQTITKPLERSYPALINAEQDLQMILVLGSSGIADPDLPITGQLSSTALSRFSEVLRLYYANPNAKIVVSGNAFGDTKSHAQLLESLALSYQIPANRIIRLDLPKDTGEEVQAMAQLIEGKRAALVTSATHMPRAMQLFEKYPSQPIPAPAMYLSKTNTQPLPSYAYIPSGYQLYKAQVAMHEYLALIFNKLKQ